MPEQKHQIINKSVCPEKVDFIDVRTIVKSFVESFGLAKMLRQVGAGQKVYKENRNGCKNSNEPAG
jgi:hypothetical protein